MPTQYDLAKYLCPFPNGTPFVLGGLGEENCQTVQAPDGWVDFRKNALKEEFYVTNEVVGRGADTSSLWTPNGKYEGTYYIQYTIPSTGGDPVYGAPWAKRQMAVGEAYHRDCTIIQYDYHGHPTKRDDHVQTDLHFTKHLDSMQFPSGVIVRDIVVLQWGGEEEYYYALGYGLVGWKNLRTNTQSFITQQVPHIQTSFPIPTRRPIVSAPKELNPVPPLPPIPFPTEGGIPETLTAMPSTFVNVRDYPDSTGKDVGDLRVGAKVTGFPNETHNGWLAVIPADGTSQGWVSLQGGAVVFTPDVVPPQPSTGYKITGQQLTDLQAHNDAITQILKEVKATGSGGGF